MRTLPDSFLAFSAQGVAGTGCEAPISKTGTDFLMDSTIYSIVEPVKLLALFPVSFLGTGWERG